ncbi:OmpA family protein [Maribacter algicola]|uniref:OmpA family protein n=1 Tax=Meishania litoralis TaxID=3434685 RepID=A0ACC7LH96_9FLAO
MIKVRFCVLLIFMSACSLFAQKKNSKADNYFYAYAYADAIAEYHDEMRKEPLTNAQRLNLADAYFHLGNYRNAVKIYTDIYRKDTIIKSHRFNKMLQSLAKTAQRDSIESLLAKKNGLLSDELMENADFNLELLGSNSENETAFQVFGINGNSAQTDFSPSFMNDKLLFSSSRGHKHKKIYGPSGEAYLDIYLGRIGGDGDVVNPNLFEGIPASKFHKSTPYYESSLGKIFYVISNEEDDQLLFDDNGKNSLAIALARSSSGPDRSFYYLLKDLSTSFYYPFYDEATGRLYFAANFEDSYGGTDIYYVHTNNTQIMSEPINVGPRINSAGNEIAPFIYENNLYFSSDIFYGLGGMDIYKTSFQADDSFSIPVNLGAGINSPYDDFGFIIKNEGDKGYLGYFASNRPGGKGKDDIYGFMVSELPGLKTLVLSGKVAKPKSDLGIPEATVKIMDSDGQLIKQVISDLNGQYRIEIPWRDNIMIEANKENHSHYSRTIGKEELNKISGQSFQIDMVELVDLVVEKEAKQVIKLDEFSFEKGKSDITPEISTELDKVVAAIKSFPEMKLRIESHTDSRGNRNTNQRLSQQRADAIKNFILAKGVPSSVITGAMGYGESQLVNDCKDGVYCLDFLHDQNARTLFVVENLDEL